MPAQNGQQNHDIEPLNVTRVLKLKIAFFILALFYFIIPCTNAVSYASVIFCYHQLIMLGKGMGQSKTLVSDSNRSMKSYFQNQIYIRRHCLFSLFSLCFTQSVLPRDICFRWGNARQHENRGCTFERGMLVFKYWKEKKRRQI